MADRQADGSDMGGVACAPKIRDGLHAYVAGVRDLLGEGLVGVYLYGSVASGCSNRQTSDVDVLVVVTRALTQAEKEALLAVHRSVPAPIDATYITREQLNRDCFPTPLQCVIRPVKLFSVPDGLVDFPVIRQDVYVNGVRLLGPEVRELVRPVPWEVLDPCVRQLFPVALERFKNPVLMLCRICCTLTTRRPCSKADAGRWALTVAPPQWQDLIRQALDDYARGVRQRDLDEDQARAFEQWCRRQAAGDAG